MKNKNIFLFFLLTFFLIIDLFGSDKIYTHGKRLSLRVPEQNTSKISKIELYKKYILMEEIQYNTLPAVINTWRFTEATEKAWEVLENAEGKSLDAIELGIDRCEVLQCDSTVGFGGSPDENGETTLDAMIMDGETHSVGAVGGLRRIKNAISVARKVMEHTKHTFLVGDLATSFAIKMGFKEESLSTTESEKMHTDWLNNSCQPNFWKNVVPDPTTSCGPYTPISNSKLKENDISMDKVDRYNHDTIGMVAIDRKGKISSGTSSNGARNKIPGRVGDSPIVGAGSYVDRYVGGAAATGDGDVMVRFLPSLITVEKMREGFSPKKAAEMAIWRIAQYYPSFSGAIVSINLKGEYGAACYGIPGGFPYSVRTPNTDKVIVEIASCLT